jgi:integral membrane sensor domain MASE1
LPLLGGIYAAQRKNWGLALAGSIVAILAVAPFGIVSTILVASSKKEFD